MNAVTFVQFITDPTVICWTLAAFGLGGVVGMHIEAHRISLSRRNTDDYLRADDATSHRHLSGKGTPADCSDELEADDSGACLDARVRSIGGA